MYLHLIDFFMVNVGKYTVRPMDPSWVRNDGTKSWVISPFPGFQDSHQDDMKLDRLILPPGKGDNPSYIPYPPCN